MGQTHETWLYDSELAELWGVDLEDIHKWARLGHLESKKGCACRLIHRKEVARFETWYSYWLADARRTRERRAQLRAWRDSQLVLDL